MFFYILYIVLYITIYILYINPILVQPVSILFYNIYKIYSILIYIPDSILVLPKIDAVQLRITVNCILLELLFIVFWFCTKSITSTLIMDLNINYPPFLKICSSVLAGKFWSPGSPRDGALGALGELLWGQGQASSAGLMKEALIRGAERLRGAKPSRWNLSPGWAGKTLAVPGTG